METIRSHISIGNQFNEQKKLINFKRIKKKCSYVIVSTLYALRTHGHNMVFVITAVICFV